ncbi:ATPase [Sphingobium aromaticiconvertens]|uniref:SRPBCC family protein n=1 Tax=Sphingobium aromaticiconvertens TaxID=365341 RepID=UPI003019DE7E
MRYPILMLVALVWPAAGLATVTAQQQDGFAIEQGVDVAADSVAIYALLQQPGRWWNSDHSYSGDARNMTLDARIGGCFCEVLPAKDGLFAGSVEHARVIHAAPGRTLRLVGSLGPLQAEAVTGTLTFTLKPLGAGGTRIDMTYVVGGYVRGGTGKLASAVDRVLGQQLQGLKRAADARR